MLHAVPIPTVNFWTIASLPATCAPSNDNLPIARMLSPASTEGNETVSETFEPCIKCIRHLHAALLQNSIAASGAQERDCIHGFSLIEISQCSSVGVEGLVVMLNERFADLLVLWLHLCHPPIPQSRNRTPAGSAHACDMSSISYECRTNESRVAQTSPCFLSFTSAH